MQIDLKPDWIYIVAVSGGVDSVVLLDMLLKSTDSNRQLIVAHFDHGIRRRSAEDALFVEDLASRCGLDFISQRTELGEMASEAVARKARYEFLWRVAKEKQAQALVTGHHLDDFLETVILNFHRGCQRRGLTSLKSTDNLLRPLLQLSKKEVVDYAQANQLDWLEDASNYDLKYLRNRVRHKIMPKITPQQYRKLLDICDRLASSNRQLDDFLTEYLKYKSYRREGRVFTRDWFNQLTHLEATEVVATWLIESHVSDYTQSQIDYIVVKLKTLKPGKVITIDSDKSIKLTKRSLRLDF